MKFKGRLILLTLVSVLFLTGCEDDSGFGIARHDEDYQQPDETMGERVEPGDDNTANSGATGTNDDNQQNNSDDDTNSNVTPHEGGDDSTTPVADLGNQIISFSVSFETSTEENYINITYSEDPFDTKYNFSYYTINDSKLEKSNYCFKETINEKDTYKIYLGTNESGTYVIKFYNKSGIQYGKAFVSVRLKGNITNASYFSMTFNILKVRFASVSFSIQNAFKKIGDFFSNLFNDNHISI